MGRVTWVGLAYRLRSQIFGSLLVNGRINPSSSDEDDSTRHSTLSNAELVTAPVPAAWNLNQPFNDNPSMLMIDIVRWLMVGLLTSAIWAHLASADKDNLPRTLSFGMIGAVAGGLASATAVSAGKYNIIALITSILGTLVFLFIDELIWAENRRR